MAFWGMDPSSVRLVDWVHSEEEKIHKMSDCSVWIAWECLGSFVLVNHQA